MKVLRGPRRCKGGAKSTMSLKPPRYGNQGFGKTDEAMIPEPEDLHGVTYQIDGESVCEAGVSTIPELYELQKYGL